MDLDSLASQSYVKNEVEHLKGVMKCSLVYKSTIKQSSAGNIYIILIKYIYQAIFTNYLQLTVEGLNVTVDNEGLLKVDWSLPSDECHDYNTGAWLEVIDTHTNKSITNQFIPDDCQTRNESSLSVIVHSNSLNNATDFAVVQDQQSCRFIIPDELEECKVYSVQIVPEYDSLRGHSQSTEVIIPLKVKSYC